MTINIADNTPRVSYAVAQGVTQTSFTVSFEFFDNTDLNVYVDGTLKTLTTDYTVTGGNGSTGSISISVTGASGGSTVVITRDIALERTTDFPASGAFQISSLNTELDRFTAIAADLDDKATRSLRLKDQDEAVSTELPLKADRLGKVLGFNATTGVPEAGPTLADTQSLANVSADIATLADIEDGTNATNAIQTVAGISGNVTTVAGISGNVSTVAGISSNVTAVAADATDIGTVAGSIGNVNTVAGISSNVSTVAGISSDVTAVAGDAADIGAVAAKATEIGRLGTADAVSDLNTLATADAVSDMNTLAAISTDIDTVAGISSNVTTVAGNTSNINTVAGINSNVTTVAGNTSNINTVAGISGNITAVASDATDIGTVAADLAGSNNIGTVAGIQANVNTVAGISANTTTVAGISSDVTTVAGISANTTTVAGINANVTTVAGISTDVTTVAGISSNVTAVVGDATDIGTVATNLTGSNTIGTVAGSISNVNNVGGSITNVNTVASNLASVNSFSATYRIGATDPTTSLDEGDLFYNTTSNTLKVYRGSAWEQGVTLAGSGFLPLTGGGLSGNLSFGNNNKAIFGNAFEIFHDGFNTYLAESGGTGNVYLRANNLVLLNNSNETYVNCISDGAVTLYHNNAVKLATTSTGVDVTGNIVATGTTGGVAKLSLVAEEVHGEIEGINIGNNFGGLAFKTNSNGTTAERMRIDSSGNVGIGGSPTSKLSVVSGTNAGITVNDGTVNTILFNTSSANGTVGTTTNHPMAFYSNNAERMRINSSGDVGIGRSDPQNIVGAHGGGLVVKSASGRAATTTAVAFQDSSGNNQFQQLHNGQTTFSTGSTERMRIDTSGVVTVSSGTITAGASGTSGQINAPESFVVNIDSDNNSTTRAFVIKNNGSNDIARFTEAGNFLLGKTALGTSTVGLQVKPVGELALTSNSNHSLILNRKSSDGNIALFQKDGTTVGSIGVKFDEPYIADDNFGIRFRASGAIPCDSTGNNADNQVDLGLSSVRFKDLHLSSNIYLGGSGGTSTIFSPTSLAIDIDSNNDQTDRAFIIKTGSNEIARFTESNRLGLGTTSPSAPLHVQTTSQIVGAFIGTSSDPQIYLGDAISSDNAFIMGYDRADNRGYLTVAGDSDSAFTVINGNKVGIGSSSAIERLRVSGNVELYNDNTDGYIWFHDTGTRSWSIGSDQSTGNFAITNVQGLASGHKVQIDGSGDFLVGTNGISIGSPGNSETGLDVTQGGVAQLSATGIALYLRRTVGTGDLVRFHAGTGAGGAGSISVGTTSTSYNTSSDYRLKENITDISNAIDRVKILAPKRFNFIADADTTVDGFLAHEAQAVVPEAVTGTHNEVDEDGNAIMQGIDQSKFVPLLTAALKEAITKIEDLETRLAALEAN